MISERAIDLAVGEAILTSEQAERLRALERDLARTGQEPVDDESLRFLSGFADIFVTIGLVLFLGALAYLMDSGTGSTLMYAGLAACSWVLAEFFTFKRRMALPSIVLLVVFVGAVFVLSAQIAASVLPHTETVFGTPVSHGIVVTPGLPNRAAPLETVDSWTDWLPLCLAALVAAAMAALHYVRFRVPITVAAGVGSLCVLAVSLVIGLVPQVGETAIDLVLLACGLGVFALAMRFDMSDPERATRRTDIAFWLHLLAAPLIVHPLIRVVLHGADPKLTTGAALGVLWIFMALGVVAVVIDRRAILVSGLVYAGFALGTLIRTLGLSSLGTVVPAVALALGGFILVLSAGWLPLRRALLKRLPASIAERLPHPLVTSQA